MSSFSVCLSSIGYSLQATIGYAPSSTVTELAVVGEACGIFWCRILDIALFLLIPMQSLSFLTKTVCCLQHVEQFVQLHQGLLTCRHNITLQRILKQCGILGNEIADATA